MLNFSSLDQIVAEMETTSGSCFFANICFIFANFHYTTQNFTTISTFYNFVSFSPIFIKFSVTVSAQLVLYTGSSLSPPGRTVYFRRYSTPKLAISTGSRNQLRHRVARSVPQGWGAELRTPHFRKSYDPRPHFWFHRCRPHCLFLISTTADVITAQKHDALGLRQPSLLLKVLLANVQILNLGLHHVDKHRKKY